MPTKTPNKTPVGFPGDPGYVEPAGEKYLALITTPELANPAEIAAAIRDRILAADDFDAALDMADSSAIGAKDMIRDDGWSESFLPLDITWMRSSPGYAENGSGVFILLQAQMADGSPRAITVGAENVLAAAYKGVMTGKLPGPNFGGDAPWLRFRGVTAASGFMAIWLARGEAPDTF